MAPSSTALQAAIDAIEKMRADLPAVGALQADPDGYDWVAAVGVHRLVATLERAGHWSPAMLNRIRGLPDDPALRRLIDRMAYGDQGADFRLRAYLAGLLSAPVSARYRTRIEVGLARIEERMWEDG